MLDGGSWFCVSVVRGVLLVWDGTTGTNTKSSFGVEGDVVVGSVDL